jgi:excisionase family DNA binding protein
MLDIYTLKEVADKIKIPIVTLRKYLKDGTLTGVKIGKHWRITEEQLKDFISKNTVKDGSKGE